EILVNRLSLYKGGEFDVFIKSAEHREKALARIAGVIEELEGLMGGNSEPDGASALAALRLTAPIEEDFIGLASDSNSYGATAVANDQTQLFRLHWIFTGLALTLAVSGLVLFELNRRQNGQLVAARLALGNANDELAGQDVLFET